MSDETRPATEYPAEYTGGPSQDRAVNRLEGDLPLGKAFQPWAADALRSARAQAAMEQEKAGYDQPHTPGRPGLMQRIHERRVKAEHVLRDVKAERDALEVAQSILNKDPRLGDLIDALLTLRILRGSDWNC